MAQDSTAQAIRKRKATKKIADLKYKAALKAAAAENKTPKAAKPEA